MKVAIVTKVYNEHVNLPIWIRHYSAQCPDAALFVLDHGSTDGSTCALTGVHCVPLPRTAYDDVARAEFMADFQRALLRFYDVFIYTDRDEMLLADPRRHASLAAFLAAAPAGVIAPTGLHVFHVPELEPPIDLNAPILGQRRFVWFGAGMCKPTITRLPLHWLARIPLLRSAARLPHRPLSVPPRDHGLRHIVGAIAADPDYGMVGQHACRRPWRAPANQRRGAPTAFL